MKSIAANLAETGSCTENHGPQFIAARDSRNHRVFGIFTRNGRFYAVLWADRGDGRKGVRRFPLLDEAGAPIPDCDSSERGSRQAPHKPPRKHVADGSPQTELT